MNAKFSLNSLHLCVFASLRLNKIKTILLILFPFALWAFEPHPVTPYPVVGYREEPFFDEFQKRDRKLLVWYPVDPSLPGSPSPDPWDLFNIAQDAPVASKAKLPLIVISHGYTGNPHQLSWLIRGLVYHGFIVAGIQHLDLLDGKVHINHWKRALDIKTLIDRLSNSKMAQSIDLNRIGIAGYSLGGTTAVWIAGGRTTKLDTLIPGPEYSALEDYVLADAALPTLDKTMMAKDWRDPRVKAAFIMAPAWSWLFDEESLRQVKIPVYLIAAEADHVLVTRNNAGFFARLIPQSIFQAIPGKADHFIFISALNEIQRKRADPSGKLNFILNDDVSIDRAWIQFEVSSEAARFFSHFAD